MDAQLTILDEVHIRLNNISTINGYRIDLASNSIQRARLTPFKNGDLPVLNYWPTNDSLDEKTMGRETREFSLSIEIYDTNRDEPFTDIAFKMGNDICTALFRSPLAPKVSDIISTALGGLVSQLTINSITPVIGEGQAPWCGALLDVFISYNIKTGDFSEISNY